MIICPSRTAVLLTLLLLTNSTAAKRSVEYKDFSLKGADYAPLENLRFATPDIAYVGSSNVDLFGKKYPASRYRLTAVLRVEVSDAVGPTYTSVYEKRPADFEIFVVEDRNRAIHDFLVAEMYRTWKSKELFSGEYSFDFRIRNNQYAFAAIPDLVNKKLFYVIWVNGRAVKICAQRDVGWGTMDSFTRDVFRISIGDALFNAYESPFSNLVRKMFLKLYEQGFFKPSEPEK